MTGKTKNMDNNLPLPPDKMPKCWNEEERISALFSPFRSKSANSQDWVSKYKFWQNLIYEWLKHTKRSSFSIVDLNNVFKRKGCSPLCLVTVVEELLRKNEIIPEIQFLKEPCETWAAWSIDIFVKKPLTWSFSKVKNYVINNEINKDTKYIHLQIVKELGDTLVSILERKKESILVPFSELVKCCKFEIDENISDNTVMLILIWLRREKRVIFRNCKNESELLIKIAIHPSDSVTEIEEGLYKLMKQENELIKEMELMEEEKINIINETKSYLAKGLRQVAKTYLRKKKELENNIEKRAQTLDNIQTLITSIQNTCTNTTILSAYKTGSDVLKKLNESNLSESNVKDIMDDLSEALEEQKELQSMMSESFVNDDSNIDLEQELAELMNDKNVFPSIPNTELNSNIEELQSNLENLHIKEAAVLNISPELPKKVHNKKILKQSERA
ncbi:Charged multivesicular body protein 7 [Eufriesea mexicana]|uniref:Charged multivesicular body protein 7 n=1 Tax=Eufriesea mexicana TaxID=516756 RepID=A0A310S7L8_9HYME|nr:PREDICTED: charged multivesicular body protein 7-like [Eufriesea mexicana]XP_017761969.1 PREDICTED: charged multivesicular body protein 7-like [Eufriesea mexicana]OAD53989.1 Charged multivesicular body protein 7 [Eufriesea mexicana]OAD62272.1 Charged multivesicular body protein 7 [Eufriesea mexicana]